MSLVPIARWTVAALVLHSIPAASEPLVLDLNGALDRAHRLAPGAIAARGQLAQAEAIAIGADLPFTTNPEIDAGAGPRLTSDRRIDVEARIEQNLGQLADPAKTLFRVGDLSTLWLVAHVFERDAVRVQLGATGRRRLRRCPGRPPTP